MPIYISSVVLHSADSGRRHKSMAMTRERSYQESQRNTPIDDTIIQDMEGYNSIYWTDFPALHMHTRESHSGKTAPACYCACLCVVVYSTILHSVVVHAGVKALHFYFGPRSMRGWLHQTTVICAGLGSLNTCMNDQGLHLPYQCGRS